MKERETKKQRGKEEPDEDQGKGLKIPGAGKLDAKEIAQGVERLFLAKAGGLWHHDIEVVVSVGDRHVLDNVAGVKNVCHHDPCPFSFPHSQQRDHQEREKEGRERESVKKRTAACGRNGELKKRSLGRIGLEEHLVQVFGDLTRAETESQNAVDVLGIDLHVSRVELRENLHVVVRVLDVHLFDSGDEEDEGRRGKEMSDCWLQTKREDHER